MHGSHSLMHTGLPAHGYGSQGTVRVDRTVVLQGLRILADLVRMRVLCIPAFLIAPVCHTSSASHFSGRVSLVRGGVGGM